MFVVDYDGTLARENTKADIEVIKSLSSLKEVGGFKFVLATARPLQDIERFVQIDVFDALILELGSVIYLALGETVIFKPKDWSKVISRASAEVPSVNTGEVLYYFDQDWLARAEQTVMSIGAEVPVEVKKVGSRTYVFAPRGLDKGVGFSRLVKLTEWSGHRVVAIGDSASDLPLFKLASIRVAVANADESVKRSADYVTSEAYGKGVIEAVRKIIGKNLF